MSINEVTKRVNSLGSAWEQFKSVNDRRLAEVERKGSADPLTLEQLSKINYALDGYKDRLNYVETALSRPARSVDYGYSTNDATASEHRNAFGNYLRKGMDYDLENLEKKALSVGVAADGGYLVTPEMADSMIRIIFETSPMRKVANVTTISSDSLDIIEDTGAPVVGWTTETGARADTNTPQISKKNIVAEELYALPKATQKLLDDASINVEQWLAEKIADVIGRTENTAFINGTGTGQPKGILTYTAGTAWGQVEQINSGTSAVVTADGIIRLYYALKEEYANHSTFMMSRASVQAVRLLKEATTNQYLWQPGLAAGAPDSLMGVPVIQASDMPAPAANSLSIALADFKRAYQIVDRTGIRILRDPFTDKPFVKFYATKRVGGAVANFEAIKLLKLAV